MALPTTAFELSTDINPPWTPVAELNQYLIDLAAESERVSTKILGYSDRDNNPIIAVFVGYPVAPSEDLLKNSESLMVVCQQHGDENSGRQATLEYLKKLASTTDPAVLAYLSKHPVIVVPSTNPDGFPGSRSNGRGVNLNRTWVSYESTETQAIGNAFRDYRPQILLDYHGLSAGDASDAQFKFQASHSAVVHPKIEIMSDSVRDNALATALSENYEAKYYGSVNDPAYLNAGAAALNMISILIEAADQSIDSRISKKELTRVGVKIIENAAAWHTTNEAAVRDAVASAFYDSLVDGETTAPMGFPDLSPVPLGYRLTAAQHAIVGAPFDSARLEAYEISGSTDVYVPMAQGTKRLLAYIVDGVSARSIVAATRVYEQPNLVNVPRLSNVYVRKQGSTDLVLARQALIGSSTNPQALDEDTAYEWQAQLQEGGVTGNLSAWSGFNTLTSSTGTDTTAPVVSVTSISTTDTTPIISGSCNDSTAALVLTLNGTTYNPTLSGGTWSQQVNELSVGSYTATINATDAANNSSTASGLITIESVAPPADTTAPVVSVTAISTTDTTPIISGSCDDSAAVLVLTLNGITYNPTLSGGTWSQQVNELPTGSYTATINATDAANNSSTASGLITIESAATPDPVDTTAPVVSVTSISTSDTSPIISGSCNDSTAILTLTLNGLTYNPVLSGGIWSQQVNALAVGSYTATMQAVDPANNSSTASGLVTIEQNTSNTPQYLDSAVKDYPNIPTPDAESWSLRFNTQAFTSDLTGASQTVDMPGSKWEASVTYSSRMGRSSRILQAFIAGLRGKAGRFWFTPTDWEPYGNPQGAGKLAVNANSGSSEIVTNGWNANVFELFVAGDYFEMSGELKKLLNTPSSDSNGNATLFFTPPLRLATNSGAVIRYNEPRCLMMLKDDEQAKWSISAPVIYASSYDFVEAIDI